jgi:hypothetical protein
MPNWQQRKVQIILSQIIGQTNTQQCVSVPKKYRDEQVIVGMHLNINFVLIEENRKYVNWFRFKINAIQGVEKCRRKLPKCNKKPCIFAYVKVVSDMVT